RLFRSIRATLEAEGSQLFFHVCKLSREKGNHLTAAKLFPDDDLLCRMDTVDLKHVLGDIQTDCGNLHMDGSLMWFIATITLRRFVAGSGRGPPNQQRP